MCPACQMNWCCVNTPHWCGTGFAYSDPQSVSFRAPSKSSFKYSVDGREWNVLGTMSVSHSIYRFVCGERSCVPGVDVEFTLPRLSEEPFDRKSLLCCFGCQWIYIMISSFPICEEPPNNGTWMVNMCSKYMSSKYLGYGLANIVFESSSMPLTENNIILLLMYIIEVCRGIIPTFVFLQIRGWIGLLIFNWIYFRISPVIVNYR